MLGDIPLVMGRDYNTVLDNIIDKSPLAVSRHNSKAEMALKILIKDQALVDIWRLTHPKEENFTFYSIPHNSHSRLDFFLVNKPWVDTRKNPGKKKERESTET